MRPDQDDSSARRDDASFQEVHGALTLMGSLGAVMILSIGGGFAAGLWIGGHVGHPTAAALGGCVLGTGMGFAWGYRKLMRFLDVTAKRPEHKP